MIHFLRFSCRIFKTKDDITIKISDRGGGMSRRVRRKIFNYMYSTAPKVDGCNLHEHFNSSDALKVVLPNSGGSYGGGLAAAQLPMHGLGYGLPLSRLYARWAAVYKFHHHFLLPSLPGTSWVISNWQAWTGLERTPTFTFRYSNHRQIDSTILNAFAADIKHGCGEFTRFQFRFERQAHEHCNTGW